MNRKVCSAKEFHKLKVDVTKPLRVSPIPSESATKVAHSKYTETVIVGQPIA